MNGIRWVENFYTLCKPSLTELGGGGSTAAEADVASIRDRLDQANVAYWGGRYQDAIAVYEDVAAMLTAFVSPGYGGGGRVLGPVEIPPGLFEPLLSASLELLNALPVAAPAPAAAPRIPPVDAALGPEL